MTRNEAIQKWMKAHKFDPNDKKNAELCGYTIDGYVALGMLTLDEPVDPMDKFEKAMSSYGYPKNSFYLQMFETINKALCLANLKIVENTDEQD